MNLSLLWEHVKRLPTGVLGMVAGVFIYFALSCLIRVKEKWWCKGLLYIGCWIASFMIIYIGDPVNLTCGILIFMLVLWVTCKGSWRKRLTLGLMFANTIFAFNAFYDNCIAMWAHSHGKYEFFGNMYTVARLLFAIFLFFFVRYKRPEQDFELSPSLWHLMLMLTLSPLGIMGSLILLRRDFLMESETIFSDGVLFLVVILSFAGLLRALVVLDRQQRMEREHTLALLQRNYYNTMEQQQFEIRRMRHDLSNHLQALLALPGESREEYIKGMLDNPALVQKISWCGDSTINAVLTAKEGMMRQKEIQFSAKLDIGEELPFEKADICAMFANALDNGAEACEKLEKPMRKLQLDARLGKGILAVKVENACEEIRMEEKGGLPKTTKKDEENHGFGLKSIEKAVKKYGGRMEIRRKEQSFQLFFYLPVEK